MTVLFDVPLWRFDLCPRCTRQLPMAAYELTCPCFDGLFASWSDAISAGQRELDERGARFCGSSFNTITTDRRRTVITESRRHSPK